MIRTVTLGQLFVFRRCSRSFQKKLREKEWDRERSCSPRGANFEDLLVRPYGRKCLQTRANTPAAFVLQDTLNFVSTIAGQKWPSKLIGSKRPYLRESSLRWTRTSDRSEGETAKKRPPSWTNSLHFNEQRHRKMSEIWWTAVHIDSGELWTFFFRTPHRI